MADEDLDQTLDAALDEVDVLHQEEGQEQGQEQEQEHEQEEEHEEEQEDNEEDADHALIANATADVIDNPNYHINILQTVKKAQFQNGLRHGDYQRYRKYCARKLHRLRKQLKFTFPRKEFKKKVLEARHVTEAKYLLIPLINAERAWSHAMQLKGDITQIQQDTGDERATQAVRKRHHLRRKLAKAAKWSTSLSSLCAKTTDSRTQLEAEAYAAWMNGSVLLEKDKHTEALAQFRKAKTVYESLGRASDAQTEALCYERVQAIEPSIRYCEYIDKRRGAADGEADHVIMGMQREADDLLSSKLGTVLLEARHKQAQAVASVQWQGKDLPVKNENIRVCMIAVRELEEELATIQRKGPVDITVDVDAVIDVDVDQQPGKRAKKQASVSDIFEKLFATFDDALRSIRQDIKDLEGLVAPTNLETQMGPLRALLDYFNSQKLAALTRRNLLLEENLWRRLKEQDKQQQQGRSEKKVKPDDLVSLYDKLIQNAEEQKGLGTWPSAELAGFDSKIACYRALRCFFLAEAYRKISKWSEAYALYERSEALLNKALDLIRKDKDQKGNVSKLEGIRDSLKASLYLVRANAFLESETKTKEVREQLSSASLSQQVKAKKAPKLLERLETFESGRPESQYDLLSLPPDFTPVPCKPVLFDLAWNGIGFNSLENRFKKGWLGGWFGRSS